MKANELMIGDWVKITRRKKIGKVYRIDIANGEGNGWAAVIDGDYHESDLEPIPLTPEILEKNGFEKWDGWYIHSLENFGIEIAFVGTILKIGGECGTLELPAIMYVHQLQHALKLCRIKVEIEL